MNLGFRLAAALLASSVAMSAVVADALDRRVKIQNNTKFAIVEFYASNVGTNDWQEDILGSDVLRPGRAVTINIDDGTGYCKYDLKAVFEDGDEVVKNGVNVCEIGTFTYR